MVRIAKEMRYKMDAGGYTYVNKASSFGVECLLYNVPDEIFIKYNSYSFVFDDIVNYLYEHKYTFSTFVEVNEIKKLCHDSADREIVYKGFIDELHRFYEYEI